MNFVDSYLERSAKMNSVLCVGLDPTPEHVPPSFSVMTIMTNDMKNYLQNVIRIAAKKVPVVKFQYAYYAAMGVDGIHMLKILIEFAAARDLLVILDAKRGDIGDTMAAYGEEVFGHYGADACTFIPYLGSTFLPSKDTESWLPWLARGKCVISMIRTSNPQAAQLQDLALKDGKLIYEHVAVLVGMWNKEVNRLTNGNGSVGGVVGATWPEQAPRCREFAGDDVFFLIPGYGAAQGGGADGAVGGLANSKGVPMGCVNSSRGITRDSWRDKATGQPKDGDPLELVAKAIDDANFDLNSALARAKAK